jgi:hypothetical protein
VAEDESELAEAPAAVGEEGAGGLRDGKRKLKATRKRKKRF